MPVLEASEEIPGRLKASKIRKSPGESRNKPRSLSSGQGALFPPRMDLLRRPEFAKHSHKQAETVGGAQG